MAKGRRNGVRSAKQSTRFVLDSSVVFAWYFADEADSYADGVASSLSSGEAVVPSHWPLEVAYALAVGERRKRSTVSQATTFLSRLASLPITVDEQTSLVAWSAVLPLARSHRVSAYDAAYLELAIREGLPLATLDKQLQTVAKGVGVRLFRP